MEKPFDTLKTCDDESLVRFASNGDAGAEEQLVIRYGRLVRALTHSLYLVGGDGEDLQQEGMIGLLHAIRNYRSDKAASFATFAELCIRRRLYSALRTANSDKHSALNHSVSMDASLFDGNFFSSEYISDDPEELLIDRERTDAFYSTIQKQLSDFEAKVLRYYLDGYSCREIVSLTGREYKSVDNAVQRIRRKVSRQISGESSKC